MHHVPNRLRAAVRESVTASNHLGFALVKDNTLVCADKRLEPSKTSECTHTHYLCSISLHTGQITNNNREQDSVQIRVDKKWLVELAHAVLWTSME